MAKLETFNNPTHFYTKLKIYFTFPESCILIETSVKHSKCISKLFTSNTETDYFKTAETNTFGFE